MGPMKRLIAAAAIATTGFGLAVAGVAVIAGTGPALLCAGAGLLTLGLIGVRVQ